MSTDGVQPSTMSATAAESVAVQLASLYELARQLDLQFEAVRSPAATLDELKEKPLWLGEFPEAWELRRHKTEAAAQMRGLMDNLRTAISFCEDVTNAMAVEYDRADRESVALYRNALNHQA